jgi:hypothetical protein
LNFKQLPKIDLHLPPAEVRGLLLNAAQAVFGETALQRELTGRCEQLELT